MTSSGAEVLWNKTSVYSADPAHYGGMELGHCTRSVEVDCGWWASRFEAADEVLCDLGRHANFWKLYLFVRIPFFLFQRVDVL